MRLLLLFEKEWGAEGFAPLLEAGEIEVFAEGFDLFAEGFDLFRFPGNARQVQHSVAPEASIAAAALPMAPDDPRVRDPAALTGFWRPPGSACRPSSSRSRPPSRCSPAPSGVRRNWRGTSISAASSDW